MYLSQTIALPPPFIVVGILRRLATALYSPKFTYVNTTNCIRDEDTIGRHIYATKSAGRISANKYFSFNSRSNMLYIHPPNLNLAV